MDESLVIKIQDLKNAIRALKEVGMHDEEIKLFTKWFTSNYEIERALGE
ncbi:hypothetical protein [Mesobacillus persicus]|nr:hypothetical protein [Mesobacillus persicus]